jgi:hypothetical protein
MVEHSVEFSAIASEETSRLFTAVSGRNHPFDTSSPPPSHPRRPSRPRRGFRRTPWGDIPPLRSLAARGEARSSRAENGRKDRRNPTYLDGLPVVKRNMPAPESNPRKPSIPFRLTVHHSPATGAVRRGTQGREGGHPLPANRVKPPASLSAHPRQDSPRRPVTNIFPNIFRLTKTASLHIIASNIIRSTRSVIT